VNKVSSKAILHWNLEANTSLPAEVKDRLRTQQRQRLTTEGELVIQSQTFRDQAKNVEACRVKLLEMVLSALHPPKPRKATKPSKASKRRRLDDKRQQSERKAGRKRPSAED
jgi:ribosome-associated protein